MNQPASSTPTSMLTRLQHATNAGDVEGIVACFAEDYRNETPAHPERGFIGREQVRRNWTQILTLTPDIQMQVVRAVEDSSALWSEIELAGTRLDGTPHLLRGVVIFGVEDGLARWARFYLEPVETASGNVDRAIRTHLTSVDER